MNPHPLRLDEGEVRAWREVTVDHVTLSINRQTDRNNGVIVRGEWCFQTSSVFLVSAMLVTPSCEISTRLMMVLYMVLLFVIDVFN